MSRGKAPAPAIPMSDRQYELLTKITKEHKCGQQLVKRITILLLAKEGLSHGAIKRRLGVSVTTIKKWRNRWLSSYDSVLSLESEPDFTLKAYRTCLEEIVSDLPRSGTPKKFSLAAEQQLVALACDKPINHGIAMTSWSQEMLAKVAVSEGIVESISRAQVGRILKNTPVATS